jgi:hypothetical protein
MGTPRAAANSRGAGHWQLRRQCRAIVPHGFATALPLQARAICLVQEEGMLIKESHNQVEPADATMISYTLLRHLGCMLEELSAQGLTV